MPVTGTGPARHRHWRSKAVPCSPRPVKAEGHGTARPGGMRTNAPTPQSCRRQETGPRRAGGRSKEPGARSLLPPARSQEAGGAECGGRRCLRPPSSEAAKSEVRSAKVGGKITGPWTLPCALGAGRLRVNAFECGFAPCAAEVPRVCLTARLSARRPLAHSHRIEQFERSAKEQ